MATRKPRTATAAAEPIPVSRGHFELVETSRVKLSPINPRKHVAPDPQDELVASVRKHGILQPILVRPLGDNLEIVAGERRWRAAVEVGLLAVPAIIRDLDDREALELAVVENMARCDLSPMEEAIALDSLQRMGATPEELAARVGRSVTHVRNRLRLMALPQTVRERVDDGKLDVSRALLVARLAPQHMDAAGRILAGYATDDDRKRFGGSNCVRATESLTEARAFVLRHFTCLLALAPFNTQDKQLVRSAGACHDCPKSTLAQADLFGGVADDDARCLDAACYAAKTEKAWERKAAAARAEGKVVLDGDEAKAALDYGSGYVEPDAVATWDGDTSIPWADAVAGLGKKRPQAYIARDDKGQAVELFHRDQVLRMLAKAGAEWAKEELAESEPASEGGSLVTRSRDSGESHQERERARRKAEAAELAVAKAIGEAARHRALSPNAEAVMVAVLVDGNTGGMAVLERHFADGECPEPDQVVATVSEMAASDRRGLLVELLALSIPDEAAGELIALADSYGLTADDLRAAKTTSDAAFERATPCPTCGEEFAAGDLPNHQADEHPRKDEEE